MVCLSALSLYSGLKIMNERINYMKAVLLGSTSSLRGCFNCATSCVRALGWLEKKTEELRPERKTEEEDEQFWISTVGVHSGRRATLE